MSAAISVLDLVPTIVVIMPVSLRETTAIAIRTIKDQTIVLGTTDLGMTVHGIHSKDNVLLNMDSVLHSKTKVLVRRAIDLKATVPHKKAEAIHVVVAVAADAVVEEAVTVVDLMVAATQAAAVEADPGHPKAKDAA